MLFPDLDVPAGPWSLEDSLRRQGFARVAGVDEAGRGPLAGPVVAAAVILDQDQDYPGVKDSKRLSPIERETAFWLLWKKSRAIGLGLVDQAEIDRTNILTAALRAMAQAAAQIVPSPDFLLVDGPFPAPLDLRQRPIPHGDGLILSIGAASIVAKVVRDRLMTAYDRLYPGYGFAGHKGYATPEHLQALVQNGPCPLHRRSFRPVAHCSSI
ncbi:MAG: ribonuclease HII [Thermodesulfobacteriota bacterium]